MKIIREQQQTSDIPSAKQTVDRGNRFNRYKAGPPVPELCGDCDALNYCQLARNLGHSHSAQLNSHKIINGSIGESEAVIGLRPRSSFPDQQILAEKLKLRYKTCPFHRELSLG